MKAKESVWGRFGDQSLNDTSMSLKLKMKVAFSLKLGSS
ncbi:unnamed protein product, partial [Vitis vinifera]|uniref:Uncharacterized protein n=1 Tax=Vitis vinifera TaxID=29760 RepID=D7T388_VITVI